MLPTLIHGDMVYVVPIKKSGGIERGNIVCFIHSEGTRDDLIFVMRVVGLPQENVMISDEYIILNGSNLMPKEIGAPSFEGVTDHPGRYGVEQPFRLGANQYFVLGDNLAIANDSRMWGALDESMLIGRVVSIKREGVRFGSDEDIK
jgi:signal peptidase I